LDEPQTGIPIDLDEANRTVGHRFRRMSEEVS
jgi:hypothetical protein